MTIFFNTHANKTGFNPASGNTFQANGQVRKSFASSIGSHLNGQARRASNPFNNMDLQSPPPPPIQQAENTENAAPIADTTESDSTDSSSSNNNTDTDSQIESIKEEAKTDPEKALMDANELLNQKTSDSEDTSEIEELIQEIQQQMQNSQSNSSNPFA